MGIRHYTSIEITRIFQTKFRKSENKEVCFPLHAWEMYMSYAACGSHSYRPFMQVWWTTEVRLPILFFFPLQLHDLAFIGYRMRYLVESKLIYTTWYFVPAMLSYAISWHSRKSWCEKNASMRLFKPSWDIASSAHEAFTWVFLIWKLTSEVRWTVLEQHRKGAYGH